ncbi:Bax inhibitor-1/YccA family protein [Streptococcus porcinus]|uniref:Integral membrane protein n=2 Tax=Streptococcus porcinus TaxID=1340 RepID=A0A4V0H867_STRPO|nr:Bax inhibitor-1/YccA family protein [Streptococcus porcinus]EGJ26485.1 putative membrane protein [Streptococcus porcinus str. Jelinkova 176]SQG44942.1 integral membrane protein [Streptococcus porcinus]VTT45540.1 integral membrane protein [Streptococcus porcinus]VTT46977.1 integral membrane protein [Streptococcus porcinus]
MNDHIIYSETDTGLSQFFAKIYGLVGAGVGLSAFVSYLMLYPFRDNLVAIIANHPFVYYGAIILELVLVFLASGAAQRNTPMALPLFLFYSALNGFTLSFIIAAYTQTTVLQAFISSAAVFFTMSMIGLLTKKDLSGFSKALMAALIGIIVASVVNLFIGSGGLNFIISIVSVLIFSGLIAVDNNRIKAVYQATNGQVGDGWAVAMALSLYLDFINLFISLLRIFGRND